MSKYTQTNRVQLHLNNNGNLNKRFKTANDKNAPKYQNRVEEEARLTEEFLKEKEVLIHKDQTVIYDYLENEEN